MGGDRPTLASRNRLPALTLNMISLLGYTDPLSVTAGDQLDVKVSVESEAPSYSAQLVRLYCGDDDPDGPGYRDVELDASVNGEYPARRQRTRCGSYVHVPTGDETNSFTALVMVWATQLGAREQVLMGRWCAQSRRGFALLVTDEGRPQLRLGDGVGGYAELTLETPLIEREWTVVAASFDVKEKTAELISHRQAFSPRQPRSYREQAFIETTVDCARLPLLMGACLVGELPDTTAHFNGKLERPRLSGSAVPLGQWRALLDQPTTGIAAETLVGAWDFAQEMGTTRVVDQSGNGHHGETVNLPTRAVTSSQWDGTVQRPVDNPGHYAAIQLHDDDVYDVGWETDFRFRVPENLASGVYAFRLRDGSGEDYVPFFVRPHAHATRARIAFLASTATYIAYINNRSAVNETLEEMQWGSLTELGPEDVYLSAHPELGVCVYDSHADGTPVFYSSRHRPILNTRPHSKPWNFCADLHIIGWLDRLGYNVDVIADEDLDSLGSELLDGYAVLITGTHPEYWSAPMLDALDAYKSSGGRLMYLGGNGFYWRISFSKHLPGALECRKTGGVRLLDPPAGERCHSFDGELGGLWRHLGRSPQKNTGVGTTAFGFADCGYFLRGPDSGNPRAAFVFEDVDDGPIGDFGLTGGAVGLEIDRTDRALGTPDHCLVLAVSAPMGRFYVPAPEETPFLHPALPGDENPNVRAEMVFYEGPNGGAVFSTGSISWAASLPHHDYDNNVSQITRNVLDRFLDPAPFPAMNDT